MFVQPLGFYLYAESSEPTAFHSIIGRQKHVSHLSPRSFWCLLKSSHEGNALLFIDVYCLSGETCELRTYSMVQARSLVSEVAESLHIVSNASKWLPFVPWWL